MRKLLIAASPSRCSLHIWNGSGGMNGGLSQNARVLADAQQGLRLHKLPRVSRPVDVSDAEQFPNIAAAIAHAKRAQRGEVG